MEYFATERLDDGITLITENGVRPWLRCNIWHVRGRDRDLVIDNGMGLTPLKAEILKLTDRPLTAIVTHTHFDHCAGLHEFDDRQGHRAEAHYMDRDDRDNMVTTGGYVAAELIDPAYYPDFDPATYVVRAAPLTGHLDEGDVIDLGDRHFRVLHLPGHSPGSIGLHEEATGTLFSGDALYDGPMLDNLAESDPAVLRATHERLRRLAPRVTHGGHCPSFGTERLMELTGEYLSGWPARRRFRRLDARAVPRAPGPRIHDVTKKTQSASIAGKSRPAGLTAGRFRAWSAAAGRSRQGAGWIGSAGQR